MANGRIEADPLFLGLTRPSMILGVTYVYAALNAIGSVMAFIMTSNFVYLLVMMPTLHCIAYFICLKEPLMIELLLMKTWKLPRKIYMPAETGQKRKILLREVILSFRLPDLQTDREELSRITFAE